MKKQENQNENQQKQEIKQTLRNSRQALVTTQGDKTQDSES